MNRVVNTEYVRHRLLWHGVLLILLSLLTGLLVPVLIIPRLGLSAHVGGLMNGMLLMLVGFLWPELALTRDQETLACALML